MAKWGACRNMAVVSDNCLFIAWFEETRKEMENEAGVPAILTQELVATQATGKMIVFVEHHPLKSKEHQFFEKLSLPEVPVLSSLDEPLFMMFGGENTITLMKKLGMKDDEMIGHSMITASIQRAQKKIEDKVKTERTARSQEEWFAVNMK